MSATTGGGLTPAQSKWTTTTHAKVMGGGASAEDAEAAPTEQDAKAGYVWGTVASPGASKVGARFAMDDGGRVNGVRLSSRPASKHPSSHGQHTTAYAANREVVIASVYGRTETKARESLARLFGVLERFPAFTDADRPVPRAIATLVAALKDPKSRKSKGMSLDELAKQYLELRDALPGASLDTGINGSASGAGRANITGKGEGSTLKLLRESELAALAGTAYNGPAAIAAMLKLYDSTSEAAGGLRPEDRVAQRRTFLLTMAQAFPKLFQVHGEAAARTQAADMPTEADEFAAYAKTQAAEVAAPLAADNKAFGRPAPTTFAASVDGSDIVFHGRADGRRESNTMGSHTTAEQMMKNAAAGVLLTNGDLPTAAALIRRLNRLTTRFSPDKYEFYRDGADDGLDDDEVPALDDVADDDSSSFTTARQRVGDMKLELDTIAALVGRLQDFDGDEVVDEETVAEAAEAYMELVDSRPTAVTYKGPANYRGEAQALRSLETLTRRQVKPETLDLALELFDLPAVNFAREKFEDESCADDYVNVVISEFLFFLDGAYPEVFLGLRTACAPSISDAIKAKLRTAVDDDDDGAYEEEETNKRKTKTGGKGAKDKKAKR